jgi:hypothetical protein
VCCCVGVHRPLNGEPAAAGYAPVRVAS